MSGGNGNHVLAFDEETGQFNDVVVRLTRIRSHRTSSSLDTIDGEHVASIDPEPTWCCRGDTVKSEGPAQQSDSIRGLIEDRSCGRGCRNPWSLRPDPSSSPSRSEGCRMSRGRHVVMVSLIIGTGPGSSRGCHWCRNAWVNHRGLDMISDIYSLGSPD